MSKSGRESLRLDHGTKGLGPSHTEMGTIVHLSLWPVPSLAARQSGWVDPQKRFIKPMENKQYRR